MATPLPVSLVYALRGRTYTFAGVWSAGPYQQLDVVSNDNAFWYAKRANSVEPSASVPDDWELLIDFTSAIQAASDLVNIDGGGPDANYGGIPNIDCGEI